VISIQSGSHERTPAMNKGNLILAAVVLSSLFAVLGGCFVDGH
jgi:hypothetical protein